jgi:uncharacterized linocin/CFP29 family protein
VNNLHRDLAPISEAAWTDLEQEARRTFTGHIAGRRVVDVDEDDLGLAAVSTGHIVAIDDADAGVQASLRIAQPLTELRVPFTVSRSAVDAVERGAKDADWAPVKDAARRIAFAEDRAIFNGFTAAGIDGIRAASSNPAIALPADIRQFPDAVTQALSALRLAGVEGPYSLVLSADAYAKVTESADHGYPVINHLTTIIDGEIVWAPALDGAFLLSMRGGDHELQLGQDLSIGYLSHDAEHVTLYFQETLTFVVQTPEASVVLDAAGG